MFSTVGQENWLLFSDLWKKPLFVVNNASKCFSSSLKSFLYESFGKHPLFSCFTHTRKSSQRKKHAFYNHLDTKNERKIQAGFYKFLNLYGRIKSSSSFRVLFFQLICSSVFTSKSIKMPKRIKRYITQILMIPRP